VVGVLHKKEMPVNLVMCIHGMEENGSEGLDALVEREKDAWFNGVDFVYIVSLSLLFSFWISSVISLLIFWVERQPLGQHAHARTQLGLVYFKLTVSGPGSDLHSGVCCFYYSHSPFPPFLPHAGNILVPGVDDMVQAAGWRSGACVVLYLFIRGFFLS
jgi:Cys-Gly metallodipeptidase DUG1